MRGISRLARAYLGRLGALDKIGPDGDPEERERLLEAVKPSRLNLAIMLLFNQGIEQHLIPVFSEPHSPAVLLLPVFPG